MLLKAGADPNQKEHETAPYPICQAAQNNDTFCVRLLLEKGACKGLDRALQSAAGHNSLEIVKLLLLAGADPNNVQDGHSPLIQAASHRNIPMIQSLLEHAALINHTSYYLQYQLRRAQEDGNNALVSIFKNAEYLKGEM